MVHLFTKRDRTEKGRPQDKPVVKKTAAEKLQSKLTTKLIIDAMVEIERGKQLEFIVH